MICDDDCWEEDDDGDIVNCHEDTGEDTERVDSEERGGGAHSEGHGRGEGSEEHSQASSSVHV